MPLFLFLSLPYLLVSYIVSKFSRKAARHMAYAFGRPYSIGILRIIGAHLVVTGSENLPHENSLFVANHRSLLDSPLLMAVIKEPLSFISKMEMKKVPIFSQWMMVLQCLFLDRNNNRAGLETILQGIENLKTGDNLAIFPQGTRSKGDEFLPFKAGSFKLAVKSGKPIVPIAIQGTDGVFENNGMNVKPGDVHVRIFPAIETKGLSLAEQKELAQKVEDMIRNQYDLFQKGIH